jgi:hypothetical protein
MCSIVAGLASWAPAQATKPPLGTMQEFDRGVQQLYRDVHESVVRVVVPLAVAPQTPEAKLRQQLEQQKALRVFVERPPTQPLDLKQGGTTRPSVPLTQTRVVLTEFVGVVLDAQGHVLIPLYLDKQLVGDNLLRVTYGDNQVTTGKLVGSDRQTNLSVMKLTQPVGKPVKMAEEYPNQGALVLSVSPVRRQAHLGMWTGGGEEHSVVINAAGELCGFNRYGHVFEPRAFDWVAQQLVEKGSVRRAVLGIFIVELGPDDPARAKYPEALGNKPATRVETVGSDSLADRAGLQQGDIILSIGGDPVNDLAHFAAVVAKRTGQRAEVKILRDGKEMGLMVELMAKEEK